MEEYKNEVNIEEIESNEKNVFDFTKEREIMSRACDLASHSIDKAGGPFGCVITDKDGNEIATGHNMVTLTNDPTAHAEVVTIREACKKLNTFDLSGCKLFTSCEPCPMCLSAIYWSRITDVYYANTRNDAKNIGFDDEFIYDELKKENKDKCLQLKQIYCPNAQVGFDLWKNKIDKIKY
jgi:tRNA(Arg) A34 adenosine deaminase TadA